MRTSTLLLAATLWFCVAIPATADSVSAGGQVVPRLSVDDEKRLGQQVAITFFRRYGPLVHDADLLAYLNRVGMTVAAYSERNADSFRFALIDNDAAHAFALPGSYIIITTALLHLCEDEAELAALLAHEVAHVASRHLITTLQKRGYAGGRYPCSCPK